MAETAKSEQPQTNGLENGLDEDERSKMRPADIDADVKEMERRKRVEMIMSSKLFREELERIIELQLKDGNGPAGLLQQISDMMGIQSGKLHTTHMFRGSNCVTPINDIRGVESMGYEKGEKNLRCKLASVFRLMDLYGWSQGINNQITARLNQDEEHFLVNPHGMLFNEITASSLVKVDMQGNIVEPGTTNFSVNTQGFLLHSAIHASRPDVNCVIHIKTPSVLAVSSLKCGLLPICQEALVIGEVSQHPFVSGIFEPEEREKIIRNLGPHNKVLLLHNHGAVCCGATVEEAFYNVYNTVLACETQMKLMPIGMDNLLLVSDETRKQVYDAAHRAPDAGTSGDKKKFRVGEMEFEALIRMLDNAGFRTGYIYRHPLVKGELPKPKNDVEVPPAVSSLGYLIEQEELYKQGNWKKYIDGRNRLDRTKWLNSPNVYQKVEILETGTSDPKKITKWVDQNSEEWVAESSPTHSSTPVKIDSALQFVPKGTNPKEFKKLQQQIKENRRADKITSGPQSHILEGVSWEEAKKLQDANITQTGDQVILVGAASKGIIQRNYQHNALVYKTPYAKNPFDSMSDKEIEDYKQLVERKQRGDTDYEESQSESEAISSSRQDALRHFKSPLLSPQSATSETEEESRDEPRVLRIETKTAPRPIQAEVVLSDGESDTTDARVERSHSARYPKAEKPESVTLMNSFRKSWSLKREKDKSKDVDNIYESRNLQFLKDYELDRTDSLHCCVARVKQLTQKPIIVDLGSKSPRPLLKSASDPCNLSTLNDENASEVDNRQSGLDVSTSLSCTNIVKTSELQQRLNARKKLLHSAKMKFLGYPNEADNKSSKSPMRVLISEIRDTINEIMSPERSKTTEDSEYFDSMKWINRSKFGSRSNESKLKPKGSFDDLRNKVIVSKSLTSLTPTRSPSETFTDFKNEFTVLKMDLERSDTSNCDCAIHGGNIPPDKEPEEKQPPVETVHASDDEATYTITEDSLLPTYSFTESTETEWYYSKTIMKLENSQTMLEIKDIEGKDGENLELPVKYVDTGIDTDFASDKEVEVKAPAEEQKEVLETTEDNDAPVLESSGLNKSSETDSSFLKSSSGGRTSNDVDTSFAFKTETETSDKTPEKGLDLSEEKKNFLKEMLQKTKEPIKEESSDSEEANLIPEKKEESDKLEKILESPEFTNVDTEDAPITSSSKDTSPEIVTVSQPLEDEPKIDVEEEKENIKTEHKRKKSVKTGTKITVKKELKEKNSNEPVVSEIKLTIKNLNKCQSEKYEVKIQDVTNTSEELSRSVSSAGENIDGYESFEIVDKSCDCEAQQNLEELQGEVSSTIEKLQTIENYFEDEIKKHSNLSPEKRRNGSDEFTIEYNYREFEEVLNESRGKMAVMDVPDMKTNTEFYVSSQLGEICGQIEVCDDGDVFEAGDNPERGMEKNVKNLAMSSAFVAALLSEAVLGADEEVSEKLVNGMVGTEVELICDIEVPDVANFEVVETEEDSTSGSLLYPSKSEVQEENKLQDLEKDIIQYNQQRVDEDELKTRECQMSNLEQEDCKEIQNQQPEGESLEKLDAENIPQQECQLSNLTQEEINELQGENFVVLENENHYCQQKVEIQSQQLEEEIEHQNHQQELVFGKHNPLEQPEEAVDCWNEEEDCQQKLDEIKNDEQQESIEVDYNGKNEIQMESETTKQDCQPKFDQEKDEKLADQQEIQEYQPEVLKEETTKQDYQPKFEPEKVDLPVEIKQQEFQEYEQVNLQLGNETAMQDYQPNFEEEKDELPVETDQQEIQENQPEVLKGETTEQDYQSKVEEGNVESPVGTDQQEIQKDEEANAQLEEEKTTQNCQENNEQTVVDQQQEYQLTQDEINDCLNYTIPQSGLLEGEICQYYQLIFDEEKQVEEENLFQQNKIDDYYNNNIPQEVGDVPNYHTYPEEKNLEGETVISNTKDKPQNQDRCDVAEEVERRVIVDDVKQETQAGDEKESQDCQPVDCLKEETNEEIELSKLIVEEILDDVERFVGDRVLEVDIDGFGSKGIDENELQDEAPKKDEEVTKPDQEEITSGLQNVAVVDTNGNDVTTGESQNETIKPPECVAEECKVEEESKTTLTNLPEIDSKNGNPLECDVIVTNLETQKENTKPHPQVSYIMNCLLTAIIEQNKINTGSVSDVINFIVTNEESPTDSLTEFEDMENIISTSSSVVADIIDSIESQLEGEVESLPDEDDMKDADRKKRKKDGMFKVTIATPAKKEIFINYSLDHSSTFNTTSDLDQIDELCNSYIKTDDVNEDFENLSDFYSIESSGKNSLNSSFCSVDESAKGSEHFCCLGCEDDAKSPRSLAIIQEVDEGDTSASDVDAL